MKALLAIGWFALRNAVASAVVLGMVAMALTVIYVALVVVALATGTGIGSPIAYPFWLLIALVVAGALLAVVLVPASAIAEVIAWRVGVSRPMQLPIGLVAVAVLATLVSAVFGVAVGVPVWWYIAIGCAIVALLCSALFVPFWMIAQSGPAALWLVRRLRPRK